MDVGKPPFLCASHHPLGRSVVLGRGSQPRSVPVGEHLEMLCDLSLPECLVFDTVDNVEIDSFLRGRG
jgi:hypothetical protein